MVLEKNPRSNTIKAEALLGLGRLASIDSHPDKAMMYYHQAAGLEPTDVRAVSSQAVLLEHQGKFADAYQIYNLASSLSPNDISLKAAAEEIRDRLEFSKDQVKQERIDRLIKEILAAGKAMPIPAADEWTSKPLTVWLLDFQTSGFSPQEGTERLIHGVMTRNMAENKRIQVVERELLDKLLSELEIGSSPMTSRETALTVGRIAAARILLFGHLFFQQAQLKATVRMVETETGLVLASVVEDFSRTETVDSVATKLCSKILAEVVHNFPVRAKVTAANKDMAVIDVGERIGVTPGMMLSGQDSEITVRVLSVENLRSEVEVLSGESILRPGAKLKELSVADK